MDHWMRSKRGSLSKFNELKGSRENNQKTSQTADYLNTGALPGSTIHAWVRLNYAPPDTTRVRRKRFLCLGFEDALYPARQFRSNIQKCARITEKVLDHQEKSKNGLLLYRLFSFPSGGAHSGLPTYERCSRGK